MAKDISKSILRSSPSSKYAVCCIDTNLTAIAFIYCRQRKYDLAMVAFEESLKLVKEHGSSNRGCLASHLTNIANIYYIQKKFQALKTFLYDNKLHYRIECSNCKECVIGTRYACAKCDKYNLCSDCIKTVSKNNHEHKEMDTVEEVFAEFE